METFSYGGAPGSARSVGPAGAGLSYARRPFGPESTRPESVQNSAPRERTAALGTQRPSWLDVLWKHLIHSGESQVWDIRSG
jgi:hypothetical protein